MCGRVAVREIIPTYRQEMRDLRTIIEGQYNVWKNARPHGASGVGN